MSKYPGKLTFPCKTMKINKLSSFTPVISDVSFPKEKSGNNYVFAGEFVL